MEYWKGKYLTKRSLFLQFWVNLSLSMYLNKTLKIKLRSKEREHL